MIKIEQILLDQMTDDDKKWLEIGSHGSWDKSSAKDQLKAVAEGYSWIFRITGSATGVFVLSVANREERILCISAMAGKGILRHFSECYQQVRELCKSRGTKKLVGWVNRPGLMHVYKEKTKALPTATAFIEDLT